MATTKKTTAKHYTAGRGGKNIRMIVIHSAENQELPGQAKHLADWFAGPNAPEASAQYMVDNKTVVQSVDDTDTAWADDVFSINQESENIELTGHANQTVAEWHDAYSKGVLSTAGQLCVKLAKEYGIPAIHLTTKQILDGKTKGFCTHADITAAYKVAGGHTDPGVNFPMTEFLSSVANLLK